MVGIKKARDCAVKLQHDFRLSSLGHPEIAPALPVAPFDNKTLIGVEIFDRAAEVLRSAPDVSLTASRSTARILT